MAHAPIAMILTAGLGTRLYPLSLLRPKPLMEVAAKPIIYFIIKMLEKAGIKDVICNLHYYPEQVRKVVESYNFKCRVHFVYEKKILGTAGGIVNALYTLNIRNRNLIVVHGDILCDIDVKPFLETRDFCSLICDEDRQIEGYRGSVGVDNRGSIVELGKFYESSLPINRRGFFTGIHFLSSSSLELLKECQKPSLVAEVYPQWLRQGRKIKGIIKPLIYDDLGSAKRIFRANMSVLTKPSAFGFLEAFSDNLLCYGDNIFISKEVRIGKNVNLYGPLLIAAGAQIGEGARIGPNVIIGENSLVKPNAIVSNSVIMSRSTIEKDERIDCAIILSSVRVLVKDIVGEKSND